MNVLLVCLACFGGDSLPQVTLKRPSPLAQCTLPPRPEATVQCSLPARCAACGDDCQCGDNCQCEKPAAKPAPQDAWKPQGDGWQWDEGRKVWWRELRSLPQGQPIYAPTHTMYAPRLSRAGGC